MSTSPRRIPTVPYLICMGLIYPPVMLGATLLLEKLVFGQRLWMLGFGVGALIGMAAAIGALRLWVGRLPTVWSEEPHQN